MSCYAHDIGENVLVHFRFGENVLVHFRSGENVLVPFCVKMYLYICGRRIELAVCVFSSSRLDATLVVLL